MASRVGPGGVDLLTNTNSVGVVRDAVISTRTPRLSRMETGRSGRRPRGRDLTHPQRLRPARAACALHGRPRHCGRRTRRQRNVGGTRMICCGFARHRHRRAWWPASTVATPWSVLVRQPRPPSSAPGGCARGGDHEAPRRETRWVPPHRRRDGCRPASLERLARRAALGWRARARPPETDRATSSWRFRPRTRGRGQQGLAALTMLPNDRMDALFEATVGRRRAIVNALWRAHDDRFCGAQ